MTVAQAAALGRAIVGDDALRYRSFVQAHGTGTPQNRVTESLIFSEIAKVFGMENWPVTAIKSYLGHSIGAAGGDQIMATLGVWKYGFIPGIRTIRGLAEDVHSGKLNILLNHLETGADQMDLALINAKGFGGNNATALLLSPEITRKMLKTRHGDETMTQWQHKNESVARQQDDYEQRSQIGKANPIYQFGKGVLDGSDLEFNQKQVTVPGYGKALSLEMENPFWEF